MISYTKGEGRRNPNYQRSLSPTPSTGGSGYSIINQQVDPDKPDEALTALRAILEQEQKKLKKVFTTILLYIVVS